MEKVNKLISIRPLKSRYVGEIGDVVVARVTEVQQKRWKVNTNSRLDSILFLAAVNLPGGDNAKCNQCITIIYQFNLYRNRWTETSSSRRWTEDAQISARRWSDISRGTKCVRRWQSIAAHSQLEIRQIVSGHFSQSVSIVDKTVQNSFPQFDVRRIGDIGKQWFHLDFTNNQHRCRRKWWLHSKSKRTDCARRSRGHCSIEKLHFGVGPM